MVPLLCRSGLGFTVNEPGGEEGTVCCGSGTPGAEVAMATDWRCSSGAKMCPELKTLKMELRAPGFLDPRPQVPGPLDSRAKRLCSLDP